MNAYLLLAGVGGALIVGAAALGGRGAAIGGATALAAQLWAVMLLRPAMRGPNPLFMARWLGGMGARALGLGVVLAAALAWPALVPPVPALLGYVGVLLPLLVTETRFLR